MKKLMLIIISISLIFACSQKIELKETEITSISTDEIGVILIEWKENFEADGYIVYRGEAEDEEFSAVSEVVYETQWVDSSDEAKSGATLWYKVAAIREDSNKKEIAKSSLSKPMSGSAIIPDDSVGDIINLNANFLDEDGVMTPDLTAFQVLRGLQITWNEVANADYYRIQQKDDEGNFLFLNILDGDETKPLILDEEKFDFYNMTRGKENAFKVVPFIIGVNGSSSIAGKASDIVSITIPESISSLTYTNQGNDIIISWNEVTDVEEYKLIRNTVGESESSFSPPETLTTTTYTDNSGLDQSKKYEYEIRVIKDVEIRIDNVKIVESKLEFLDDKKVVAKFIKQFEITASQGTFDDKIEITWNKLNGPVVNEFTVYRQKVIYSWTENDNQVSFIEVQYDDIDSIKTDSISEFVDGENFSEVTKLLELGTVSALEEDGVTQKETITFVDDKTDKEKLKAGLYRYYVISDTDAFGTNTGYREITDAEFIQLTNRYFDFMARGVGSSQEEVTSVDGGTFRYTKNGATNPLSSKYEYEINNFNINGLIFTSSDLHDVKEGFQKWRRGGSINVSGMYEGVIEFILVRDYHTKGASGGMRKSIWGTADYRRSDFGAPENYWTQGWYTLTRGGSTTNVDWLGKDIEALMNKSDFESNSNAVEYKVEPDYNSNYIEWDNYSNMLWN